MSSTWNTFHFFDPPISHGRGARGVEPPFFNFFTNRLFLPGSTEAPLKHSAAFLVFPRDLLALFRTYKFLDIFSGVVFELGEFENPVNTCFTIHFENIQVPNADLLDVYQTHATCMGLVFNDMLLTLSSYRQHHQPTPYTLSVKEFFIDSELSVFGPDA